MSDDMLLKCISEKIAVIDKTFVRTVAKARDLYREEKMLLVWIFH